MVCSVCEKFYHGMCMHPPKRYEQIEEYVINTREWVCERCPSPDHDFEVRTGEDKEKVRQNAEILFQLREAIMMIDEIVSVITRKCDYLSTSAKMIRKQNSELRQRINLREAQSELPVTLKSWVQTRRMLKIGEVLPSVRSKYSSLDFYRLSKRYTHFKKDSNIGGPIRKHRTFVYKFLIKTPKRKKKHKVLEKLDAPPLRKKMLMFFLKIDEHHMRWPTQLILFASLILHTFVGAVVLYVIEGSHEKKFQEKILSRRSSISNEFSMVHNTFSKLEFNNSDSLLHNISANLLSSYYDFIESVILNHTRNSGFIVKDGNWDFLGSLFFCATTSMTVGFGDIVPVTDSGKIFTIIYALTGIPLFLTFASSLGKTFNDFMHLGSNKIYLRRKSTLFGYNYDVDEDFSGFPLWLFFVLYIVYVFVGSVLFMIGESWNFFKSYYFVVLTLATIGLGDAIPKNRKFLLGSIMFLIGGHVMTATAIHMIMWKLRKKFKIINTKLETRASEYYDR
ncbi:TWiK family of potassium channels protein 7-like isoform X2 [Cimex lectularius]|nr:TWiK family of potassium channels protein 7-like isoform X2 [Cimex lectularius]